MPYDIPLEELARQVADLDRAGLLHELTHWQGRLALDFTADFLDRQSDDRLRHLLMAVALVDRRAAML